MRELTYEEMEQVDGGVGPLAFGAVMGGAYGAVSGYDSGGIPGAIGGFALGSVTGFFGGIAAATTGVARCVRRQGVRYRHGFTPSASRQLTRPL